MNIEQACKKALVEMIGQAEQDSVEENIDFNCHEICSELGHLEFEQMDFFEFANVTTEQLREIARIKKTSFEEVFKEYELETSRRNKTMLKQAQELVKQTPAAQLKYNRATMKHDDVIKARNDIFDGEKRRLEKKPTKALPEVQIAFIKNRFGSIYYKNELSKVAGLGSIYYERNQSTKTP